MSDNNEIPEYTPHPFTEIFPPMSDEERKELEESIKQNGLREPIVVNPQNQILDGLNRYRACITQSIKPIYEVRNDLVTDEHVLDFMRDRNLTRRMLSSTQKAAIGAGISEFKRGRPKSTNSGISEATVAKQLGVSVTSIGVAKAVKRASPDLHAAMKVDAISGHAAAEILKLPEAERAVAIQQVVDSIKVDGIRKTKTKSRASGTARVKKPREPKIEIVVPGLHGPWNTLLHVLDALPLLITQLRSIGALLDEKRPPREHAVRVRSALKAISKVDFDVLRAAAVDAIAELNKIIKSDTEPDQTPATEVSETLSLEVVS